MLNGASLYLLMYGKTCHLSVKLESKALSTLKKLNLEWSDATYLKLEKMNEMDEFFLRIYESSDLCKEKIKLHYDRKIKQKNSNLVI